MEWTKKTFSETAARNHQLSWTQFVQQSLKAAPLRPKLNKGYGMGQKKEKENR